MYICIYMYIHVRTYVLLYMYTICICVYMYMYIYTCEFLLQVGNEAGRWVRLSEEAIQQFGCQTDVAYALAYSAEKKEEFLTEKEV